MALLGSPACQRSSAANVGSVPGTSTLAIAPPTRVFTATNWRIQSQTKMMFGQILDAKAHYKVFEPSEEWGNRKNLIQFSGTKTGEIMYV